MNFFYRKNYSPNMQSWKTESTVSISNFGGGMNNYNDDSLIADNEASDTKNMKFISTTHMQKRSGTNYYSEAGQSFTNMHNIVFVDKYIPYSLQSKIVVVDFNEQQNSATLYIGGNSVNFSLGSDYKSVSGVNFLGNYYFTYSGGLIEYDGVVFHKIISPPLGKVSETYSQSDIKYGDSLSSPFKFTSDTKLELSTLTSIDITVISGLGMSWLNFPSASIVETATTDGFSYVASGGRYMGTDGLDNTDSEGQLIVHGTLSIPLNNVVYNWHVLDSTHTSGVVHSYTMDSVWYKRYDPCVNELKDSFSGLSYVPKTLNNIVVHNNRLFVSGDVTQLNSVYLTTPNNPYYFPANSSVQIQPSKEAIVDMISFDSSLVIGRNHDLFLLSGSSIYEDDYSVDYFTLKKIDTTVGFMCKNCGGVLNNFFIFLGTDLNFYKMSSPKSTDAEYLMTKPITKKLDLSISPFYCPTQIERMSSVTYNGEIYFQIKENMIVVYNYDNMAFTYYSGWNNSSLFFDGDKIISGTNFGSLVYYNDVVNLDDDYIDYSVPTGLSIDAHWYSKRFDFGSSVNYKYFKSLLLSSKVFENSDGSHKSSNYSVGFEVDGRTINSYFVRSNLSSFGENSWGQSLFLVGDYYKTPWYNLDIKGKNIKFLFNCNYLGSPFLIHDLNLILTSRDVR